MSDNEKAKTKTTAIIISVAVTVLAVVGLILLYIFTRNGFYQKSDGKVYLENGLRAKSMWIEVGGDKYYLNDKGIVSSGFTKVDTDTYFFDSEGKLQTGFNVVDDNQYYFDTDGKMLTGSQTIESKDYYFDEEGKRLSGWVNVLGRDFYYDPADGVKKIGFITDDAGNVFYVFPNGGKATGLEEIDGKLHLFGDDGIAKSGFVTDDNGETLYASKNGEVLLGANFIDDKYFLFDENGTMQKGFITTDDGMMYANDGSLELDDGEIAGEGVYKIGDKTYVIGEDYIIKTGWVTLEDGENAYAGKDGAVYFSTVLKIGEDLIYVNKLGHKESECFVSWGDNKGYVDKEGKIVTGINKIDGDDYFFDENGKLQFGWLTLPDNKEGYADKTGKMVTGDQVIDFYECSFDDDGILLEKEKKYDKLVAITYDDGPSLYTSTILDAFEEAHQHCTFFHVGNRLNWYPETVKRADKIGCEIASHTFAHVYLTELTASEMKEQVDNTNAEAQKVIGKDTIIMRPPGGYINDEVCETLSDIPFIMWNVDTLDWKYRDKEKTIKAATTNIKDGDIILMHDLYESTAEAAAEIIAELNEQGFQCVTVSELAEKRGGMNGGTRYYSFRP